VGYRSSNKTVYSAKYHVIWCPQYRRGVLAGRVEIGLKEVIGAVVANVGGEVIEVEVMPDHVHPLVQVPPAVALSKLVRSLKGRSSRLLRPDFAHLRRLPALWSPWWFVSTLGGAPLEMVHPVENWKKVAWVAHRYRLVPDAHQVAMLGRHCSDARYVWNLALEQANCYRPGRPTPGRAERDRQLAEARRGSWLGEGSSSVQQQALRDFDRALRNWWGGTHRRPTWRKAGIHEGFCVRDVTVERLNRTWATIWVPKLGPVRFRLSRALPASYGMARVSMDRSGRWHVAFSASQPVFFREATARVVGLDAGVVATLADSEGVLHHVPGLRPGEAQRLRRSQRRLARQKKGSKRRARTKTAVATLRAKEADRRRDWIEQTTTGLVRSYDLIAVEDLAVSSMLRSARGSVESPGTNVAAKRGLNRAISAQGWAMIRRRLQDKAATCAVVVVAVDPCGTSQRCAACGHTSPENRESHAVFRCRACGHRANADVNAAVNILAAGLAVAARGGTSRSKGPDETRTQPVAA
jgi:transposase/REP element-mobilizing transposase RayT